jgi:serine phosphatase RsbU (regulator of sigma subunit)
MALPAGSAYLDVQDPSCTGAVPITKSPFNIGRRDTNTLRLGGSEVSREHAQIVVDGRRYVLRDLGSKFGTFVNDVQVTEHVLRRGDRIRLGRHGGSELVFEPALGDLSGSLSGSTPSSPVSDVHQVAVLLETLRALGHARVLEEVLALVLDSAITMSGAERGFIMLANADGELEFRLARGKGKKTLGDSEFSKRSHTVPEEVFDTGRTKVIPDLEEDGLAQNHDKTLTLGIRQVLCAPLHLVRFVDAAEAHPDEKRLGVLYLDSQRIGTLLSETVRSALETLAAEAAVAIENARLYRETVVKERLEQELRIAAEIQRMLLPQAPIDRPCVEAFARSRSCRSIGGDFFDYAHQDDCRFAFTLGDVAGKGPSAALLSSLLLGMFSLATQGNDAPASVVSRVNGALCFRAIEARFATLFYGVLDRRGCLRYCNAGHNPPFVIGSSGIRRLEACGPVVGLLERAQYDDGVVQLAPGDRVVIFSDGVSEAFSEAGEEFGDARIHELLESTLAASGEVTPMQLVDALIDEVRSFTRRTPQNDDITAMVVRYRGPDLG